MQILHHLGQIAHSLKKVIRHIARKVGDESNTIDAGNLAELFQQIRHPYQATVLRVLVAVDGLAQQRNFPDSLIGQYASFFDNVCGRTTLFRTTRGWHNAIRTKFVTANHDADKGLKRRWSHLRIPQRIIALKTVRDFFARSIPPAQTDSLHMGAFGSRSCLLDQARNLGQLSCSHDDVNKRSLLKNQILILLGHAAHHANDLLRPIAFAEFKSSQSAINLVLGMFTHAARVEQNRICFFGIIRQLISILAQCGDNEFAVQHVHLAADCFNIKPAIVRERV